jgi:hypothetical protein
MRLIALISISLSLFGAGWVGAQAGPPYDSSLSSTAARPDRQNDHSQARLYTNRSLIGTYRLSYIPGLSTYGASGGGVITYDGQGHFEGHDQYSTFDGTYSVNPDGTGTATSFIRASVIRYRGVISSGFSDLPQPLPVPLKYSGPFKIHPNGAIEFETVGPINSGIGPRAKTVGTQHKIQDGS